MFGAALIVRFLCQLATLFDLHIYLRLDAPSWHFQVKKAPASSARVSASALRDGSAREALCLFCLAHSPCPHLHSGSRRRPRSCTHATRCSCPANAHSPIVTAQQSHHYLRDAAICAAGLSPRLEAVPHLLKRSSPPSPRLLCLPLSRATSLPAVPDRYSAALSEPESRRMVRLTDCGLQAKSEARRPVFGGI